MISLRKRDKNWSASAQKLFYSRLLNLLFGVVLLGFGSHTLAQEAEEERGVASDTAVATGTAGTALSYPGSRDEQELKVQKEIRPAPPGVDRRTLDQRVLKSYIKKTESESEKNKGKSTN